MKTKNSKITKRKNTYNSKGITLIALVITIIVLIILAGISINLVLGDNGIVTKAKSAKQLQEQAQLNEQIALERISNEIDKIIRENDSFNSNDETTTPIVSLNELKAGDYIKYNTGVTSVGENGVITCRVLYEASSEYGLQIISDKNVGPDITLGGSDCATGSASYNSAIETLNDEAEKYLNETYATDARCVGSMPTINANGIFTEKDTENAGPVTLKFTSAVEGANNMKGADTNYTTDQTQMQKESINIWTTGETYWLASRSVNSGSSDCHFYVRDVFAGGALDGYLCNNDLCYVYSGGDTRGGSFTSGLRPCFSLRSDITITGGDGTSNTPYTM